MVFRLTQKMCVNATLTSDSMLCTSYVPREAVDLRQPTKTGSVLFPVPNTDSDKQLYSYISCEAVFHPKLHAELQNKGVPQLAHRTNCLHAPDIVGHQEVLEMFIEIYFSDLFPKFNKIMNHETFGNTDDDVIIVSADQL